MKMVPIEGVAGFSDQPNAARTILAVDDSRTSLAVTARHLANHNYMAVLCESGPEALDLLAVGGFDGVLLDIVMPGMSGLEVLTEIRNTPEMMDLPVIMVTSRSDSATAVTALQAGADDFVVKPFAADLLAARIERTITCARRISALKKTAAALDARIAIRAVELGEARAQLAQCHADRLRLIASLQKLNERLDTISETSDAEQNTAK